jgi:hypothetical protein
VDLALVDVAAFGLEDEFDGIFECENVIFSVAVDEINKGGKCGGFAGAYRAGDENDAILIAGERKDVFEGKPEFFE